MKFEFMWFCLGKSSQNLKGCTMEESSMYPFFFTWWKNSHVSVAVFCIPIKTLGIMQTTFPNILSPSVQNQWGAPVSSCYLPTASKLLLLKVAFQRVFIPIANADKVLIFLPSWYGWYQNQPQLFIIKQLVWFPDPRRKSFFLSVSICLKRWLYVASMAPAQTCIFSVLSEQAINFSACGSAKLLLR